MTTESASLFVVYKIPFLLDEVIVFGFALFTMRAITMKEKHGQLLKLVAGVTMLALAAVMVFEPSLMENPLIALTLIVGAFGLAADIHFVTTRVRCNRAAVAAVANEADPSVPEHSDASTFRDAP